MVGFGKTRGQLGLFQDKWFVVDHAPKNLVAGAHAPTCKVKMGRGDIISQRLNIPKYWSRMLIFTNERRC